MLLAFFALLTGGFDLGRYIFTLQSLASVLSEAGRYALIPAAGGGASCLPLPAATIAGTVPFLDPAQLVETFVACPNSSAALQQVTIAMSYPFQAVTPLLSGLNGTLTQTMTFTY